MLQPAVVVRPLFRPTAGDTTLTFSDGTVAGSGTCSISVDVTVNTQTTYTNTTDNLFIDSIDTGNNASANLVVNNSTTPACTPGVTAASWDFEGGTTTATYVSSKVSTATATLNGTGTSAVAANPDPIAPNTSATAWSGTGWIEATTPTTTGPTANDDAFEITVDTSEFTGGTFDIDFVIDPRPTSDWAAPNNITANIHVSTDGGTSFTTVGTLNPVNRAEWSAMTATVTPGASTTIFRINLSGRNGSKPNAVAWIDDIVLTGCAVPDDPTVDKVFVTDPIAVGGTSTLTLTLTNPNTGTIDLTNVAISDNLPTGMTVANPSNAASTCGGTFTANVGATSISLTGGTIAAASDCTLSVDVTTSVAGPSTNVTDFISSDQTLTNSTSTGSDSATLTALSPPEIDKNFSPNPIIVGDISTLTFTITNPNLNDAITAVAFTDNLPAGVQVAGTPNPSTSNCGTPTFSPTGGSTAINFSNGDIAAAGTCTVTVDVTATANGSHVNITGNVSHDVSGSTEFGNTATDTLVVDPPSPGIAVLKQISTSSTGPWSSYLAVAAGTDVYYQITIENAGDVELTPITVTDSNISTASCTWTDPLPVASAANDDHISTCIIGPVTTTASETINTATANGDYGGATYSDTSSATYATTSLAIVKTATPSTYSTAGDVIAYSFDVTNDGFATIGGPVTIDDDKATDEACPDLNTIGDGDDYFDPGEVITCTASYTITATDVTNGSVTNTASATADSVTSPTDSETVTTSLVAPTITKVFGATSITAGGNTSLTVTIGNTNASAITLTADLTDNLPTGMTLNTAGNSGTCTGVTATAGATSFTMANGSSIPAGGCTIIVDVTSSTVGTHTNTIAAGDLQTTAGNNASPTSDDLTITSSSADLSITKSDDIDPANVGDTVTYTVTVTNNGPDSANNVTVTDTLPTGLTFVSTTGCNEDPNGVATCTLGTIASGASAAYTVEVTVDAGTGGSTLTNNVSVTADESDPDTTNNTVDETTTISSLSADLSITKSDDIDPASEGDTVTYTITVSNAGPDDANNVFVTDTVPTGLTFVSTNGCTEDTTGVPTCTLGTITAGSSASYTVTVTVDAGTSGSTLTNNVSVTADEEDPDTGNNTVDETTTITSADLSITKSDNIDPVNEGVTVTYTITVTNNGPDDANNVVVTDTLPTGLTFVSTNGCTEDTTGVPTCTLGTITAGNSASYTVEVTVDAGTAGTTLTNNVSVTADESDPDTSNNAVDETTSVGSADLAITKVDDVDPVNRGDTVTYTIVVTNNGPDDATDVTVVDTFSGAVPTVVSVTPDQGTCTTGIAFTCDLGTMTNGATVTITVVVTADTGGTINNNASVSSFVDDPDTSNNLTNELTTVFPYADLAITKVDDIDPVSIGDTVTYTITVTNNGISTANNVTVTDSFSGAAVTITGATPSQGTCTTTNPFTCDLGSLADTATATITVTATADADGTITNDVSVTADEDDPDTTNNTATETTIVGAAADLAILKVDDVDPVSTGDTVTYTITVTNNGTSDASNVTVTDTFSGAATTLISVTSSQNGCTAFPCNLGTITNGGTATITVTVTADADGTITNTVDVTADEGDPDTSNNTAVETTSVSTAAADLAITKVDAADPVNRGDTITYTITVTNNGPDDANNVTMTDTFSGAAATITAVTPSQGTCATTNPFTCDLGTITNGATATITVTATADTGGTVTNTVDVTADEGDSDTSNNTDTETTVVVPYADLSITKVDNADPVNVGNTVTYTITVTNNGISTANNVTVTDSFSGAAVTITGATPSQGTCTTTNPFTCDLGSIASGANATITVTITADAGGTITNDVTVGADEDDPDTSNNTDSETTIVGSAADLVIVKTDDVDPVNVGDTVTYTITVTNNGPSDANNVTVTDTFSGAAVTITSVTSSQNGCTAFPCNLGTIANGADATITVTVTADAGGTVTNDVSVTADEGDSDTGNNTDTETTNVGISTSADLVIIKVDDADPVDRGDTVTYTISVTNNGPDDANNVTVTDTFSGAAVTITGVTSSQGGCTTFPCNLGTIANGASATITVTVTADAGGIITNDVSVTSDEGDSDTGNNTDTETTVVVPYSDLAITKVDSADPVNVGDNFDYTIVVTNNGISDATTVMVTDTIPAGLTYVSDDAGAGPPAGNVLTWDVGPLVTGASAQMVVTVTATTPGTVTNSAVVVGDPGDPDTSNNTADEDTTIVTTGTADLSLTKDGSVVTGVSPVVMNIGDELEYTVTVTNDGPLDATNVTFTDTLSPHVDLNGTPPTACTYTANPGGTLTCTYASIPVGTSVSITYQTTVVTLPPAGDAFTNVAEVTTSDQPDPDSTPGNSVTSEDDYAQVDVPRIFDPPFGVKTNDPTGLPVLEWTMVWFNPTNIDALNATVRDTVPAGTVYHAGPVCTAHGASITTNCTYDAATEEIVWQGNIARTPIGGDQTVNRVEITFTVTVNAGIDSVDNTGELTVPDFPDLFITTVSSDWIEVEVPPVSVPPPPPVWDDPHILKSASPPFARPGEDVVFTVTVTNPNGGPLANVVIVDPIPAEFEILSTNIVSGNGAISVAGQDVTYTIPTLAAGETQTITVTAQVRDQVTAPFVLVNTACIGTDNCASATVVSVEELPRTGETPWWRTPVLAVVLLVIGGVVVTLSSGYVRKYVR